MLLAKILPTKLDCRAIFYVEEVLHKKVYHHRKGKNIFTTSGLKIKFLKSGSDLERERI